MASRYGMVLQTGDWVSVYHKKKTTFYEMLERPHNFTNSCKRNSKVLMQFTFHEIKGQMEQEVALNLQAIIHLSQDMRIRIINSRQVIFLFYIRELYWYVRGYNISVIGCYIRGDCCCDIIVLNVHAQRELLYRNVTTEKYKTIILTLCIGMKLGIWQQGNTQIASV
jgi:hypothetical protein